jgi:hypothetical protein
VVDEHRWRSNWTVVGPPGAVRLDLPRSAMKRRAVERTVEELPAGTPVVLCASAPRAMGRCRTFASRAGVELDRAYLAFPSAAAPAYLVDDAPAPVALFAKNMLVAPPGTALSTPIAAVLAVVRAFSPWRMLRLLAPGHVAVGRRT